VSMHQGRKPCIYKGIAAFFSRRAVKVGIIWQRWIKCKYF